MATPLQIGKVAQRKLKLVHAINKSQIDAAVTQHGKQVILSKKCIAGGLENLHVWL